MPSDRARTTRRAFLLGAGGALVATACGGGVTARPASTTALEDPLPSPPAPDDLRDDPFTLGVASGDPTASGVVLWTRLAPDPLAGGGMGPDDVTIAWEVAADETFRRLVATGTTITSAAFAHSAHVDVSGLPSDEQHFYRFRLGRFTSPVGRTRTLPPADATPDRLVFTASACQDDQDGFRTAYPHLAAEDAAFNLFLGDYIYENDSDADRFRPNGLPEAVDLAGYRHRYAFYKADPDLQAAHAALAWVVTWDDHEVVNNYSGLADQIGTDTATFTRRRAAAYQAWWEHQPVRLPPPTGPDLAIHRTVDAGRLLRLAVLDTRQHRDDQACGARLFLNLACGEEQDTGRTMLGAEQRAFVADALESSSATWNVLGQQVVMAPLPIEQDGDLRVGLDAWDGYPVERATILELLSRVPNPVVLSADFHAGIVADLHLAGDATLPVVATELGVGSVSSGFPRSFIDVVADGASALPHVRHFDNLSRGYLRCELTPDEWRSEFRLVETTLRAESGLRPGTSWVIRNGAAGATPA